MIAFENDVIINRPVSEVFCYLSQLGNTPKWNYAINSVIPVDRQAENHIGRIYNYSREFLGNTETGTWIIKDYKINNKLVVVSQNAPHPFAIHYHFKPIDDNTTILVNRMELSPKGFLSVMAPLFERKIKNNVKQNLEVLKKILEEN